MWSYILLKEDVVLRAHSQRETDGVHVRADVFAIDGGCPGGGREHTCQDGPGRKRSTVREIHKVKHGITEIHMNTAEVSYRDFLTNFYISKSL